MQEVKKYSVTWQVRFYIEAPNTKAAIEQARRRIGKLNSTTCMEYDRFERIEQKV